MAKLRKPKFYYDPCFRQNFYFFIGWPENEFHSYTKKHFDLSFSANNQFAGKTAMIERDDKCIILVWTNIKASTPKGLGILAHECLHAIGMCFAKIDVKYAQDNDEPFAYLLARLVEEALSNA